MFVKKTIYSFFVLFLGLFFLGCKKAPNYPKGPTIQFDNLNVKPVTYYDEYNIKYQVDSLYTTIRFQDGDGDIGNDPANSAYVDFFADPYKKINGVFTRVDFYDNLQVGDNYNGLLPDLNPSHIPGPIDGKITNIPPALLAPRPGYPYPSTYPFKKDDTLKFHIRIRDRAGNYSNWVETTEFILWKSF